MQAPGDSTPSVGLPYPGRLSSSDRLRANRGALRGYGATALPFLCRWCSYRKPRTLRSWARSPGYPRNCGLPVVAHPQASWAYYGTGLLSLRQDDLSGHSRLNRPWASVSEADLPFFFPTARIGQHLSWTGALLTPCCSSLAMEQSTATESIYRDVLWCPREAHMLAAVERRHTPAERTLALARAYRNVGTGVCLHSQRGWRDPRSKRLSLPKPSSPRHWDAPAPAHCHAASARCRPRSAGRSRPVPRVDSDAMCQSMEMAFWLPRPRRRWRRWARKHHDNPLFIFCANA